MIYELKEPIHFGTEVITRLEFKPLKAKHVRGSTDKSGIDQTLQIASKITGKTSEQLDEMGIEDLREVIKIIQGFLNPGPKTTEVSTESSL